MAGDHADAKWFAEVAEKFQTVKIIKASNISNIKITQGNQLADLMIYGFDHEGIRYYLVEDMDRRVNDSPDELYERLSAINHFLKGCYVESKSKYGGTLTYNPQGQENTQYYLWDSSLDNYVPSWRE